MKRTFVLCLFVVAGSAAFPQKFIEGHYYTHDGQRIAGLIHHSYMARFSSSPDNYIEFKATPEAKEQKLTTKEVRSFVAGNDSFIIVKNFAINGFAYYDEDFVKVVKSGRINLYLHYSTVTGSDGYGVSTSTVTSYLVEKDGVLMRMKKRDFKEKIGELFGDNKELLQKLRKKDLTYKDIEKIIEEYNTSV